MNQMTLRQTICSGGRLTMGGISGGRSTASGSSSSTVDGACSILRGGIVAQLRLSQHSEQYWGIFPATAHKTTLVSQAKH